MVLQSFHQAMQLLATVIPRGTAIRRLRCRKLIHRIAEEAHPGQGMTFLEAIDHYERLGKGDGNERFLIQLSHDLGAIPITEIDQDFVDRYAYSRYPEALSSTINRAVYTPISCVLRSLNIKGYTAPRFKRPEKHLRPSNFKRPPDDWWARVLPECSPHLKAYHLFCTLHGRRPGEAIRTHSR